MVEQHEGKHFRCQQYDKNGDQKDRPAIGFNATFLDSAMDLVIPPNSQDS